MAELPPVLWFVVGAALVVVLPRRLQWVAMLGVPVVALAQVLTLDAGASATVSFFGYEAELLRVDRLSRAFGVVFAVAAALGGLYGLRTMGTGERAATLVYAGSALGVVFAGDLIALFVFWELKVLASTGVVWAGRMPDSARAGLRYLYVHVAGGSLLLGGILTHLSTTGDLSFAAFDLGAPGPWLILAGFVLSAAVPPLHAWLPDAYPQASVAGAVFLSAYTTKAAVYALARGFPGAEVLVWAGVIMALYGVVYAVLENDIRRLLGYHIISQVGYMVAAVGLGTAAAINGATAHAFAHILYKGLLLMGAGAVLHATGRSKLTELGGIARQMPLVVVFYMIGALSISGVPLFSGFVSKELTIHAGELLHREVVVDLLKLASVGTFLHTGLKLPYFTWFGAHRGARVGPLPASMLVAMGLAAAINVVIGLAPGLLYGLLPYPVDFEPYTVSHLSSSLQMLAFTGLAFWLLIHKLGGEPTITVDTDWTYRALPQRLRAAGTVAARTAGVDRVRPALSTSAQSLLARVPVAGASRGGQDAHAPVVPTWLLGAVALTAFVGLLALGFQS